MKIYLVGGAVRDRLLGYSIKERDWVVVGSTPEEMLSEGFKQVGRDFPVFLHPKTHEEYALARTERKIASGYYGFQCDCSPNVTLEADLLRRDLTINAMAMDPDGRLIDPYHGEQDLQKKVLRHVSLAFAEDPVRILRVARFLARYHHLGFTLAEETRMLMAELVRQGEMQQLVAERVWQEWQRSLEEKDPHCFITALRSCGALQVVLPELDVLFGIPNRPTSHPEIDTGVHTLMVLQKASRLTPDPLVRFAAVLHDLGKACTSIHAWPRHDSHDEQGVMLIRMLCERLRIPVDYRNIAVLVARYHLKIHRIKAASAVTLVQTLLQVDAFRRGMLFEKLLLACEADASLSDNLIAYLPAQQWREILDVCKGITTQSLIAKGYQGEAIKAGLQQLRVDAVRAYLRKQNET